MIINLTEDHIRNGKKFGSMECPVALALIDATNSSWLVSYRGFCRHIDNSNEYCLPLKVRNFIERFDRGLPVKPMRFRLMKYKKESIENV